MTKPSHDDYRDMQTLLDEAARRWQPRHAGWNTLVDRLPERESLEVDRVEPMNRDYPGDDRSLARQRGDWMWLVVSASVLVAIVVGLVMTSGRSLAQALPIEVVRRGVQVTIFNATKNTDPTLYSPTQKPLHLAVFKSEVSSQVMAGGGLMLVRDRRLVLHLRAGDNEVRFTDVAASIDPTSVRLVSDTDPLGTTVVEQSFEFDLATADGILQRSLEKKISCVDRERGDLIEGYLLSFDGGQLILGDQRPGDDPESPRPKTQIVARGKLRAIQVAELPRDLHTRPTLVWKLRTRKPGNHNTTLTYLCGNAVWRADYVAELHDIDGTTSTLDLKGWVTVENRSGTSFENAGLKLIAGDVNRVRDPWAVVQKSESKSRHFFALSFARGETLGRPLFVEKSFFEYKLYALSKPSTIKDRQVKQLELLRADQVRARRRLICRSVIGEALHPEVRLQIDNKETNHLGRPLPKGSFTLMAKDGDGESHYLSRVNVDHTSKNEKVNLSIGSAFDVVYAFRVVDVQRPAENRAIETYEFRIRNHKRTAADVRLVGRLTRTGGSVLESSDRYTQHDHRTLHFDFIMKPDTEKVVTYKVDYRW